jgi:hypothetical protein
MSTPVSLPLLQRISIAAPCHQRWEDMTGDDRTRHCGSCKQTIHNIAGMTEADAEALLRSALNDDGTPKQHLCARIYRRADGTVLTADCPVGLRALRAKARRSAARVAAALGLTALVAWAAASEQRRGEGSGWRWSQPFAAVGKAIGRQPPVQQRFMILGWISASPVQAPPATETELPR